MFAAERLKHAETTKTPKGSQGAPQFASPAVQVEAHGILLRRRGAKTWRIRFDVKQEKKCITKLGYHDILFPSGIIWNLEILIMFPWQSFLKYSSPGKSTTRKLNAVLVDTWLKRLNACSSALGSLPTHMGLDLHVILKERLFEPGPGIPGYKGAGTAGTLWLFNIAMV